jgi:hypothetical protein
MYVGKADLSFGGRPRRLGCALWEACSGVLAPLCGVAAALLALELRRMVACLTVPSDMRFLEGERTIFCSFCESSATVEEHMEDIAVLVADSNEPYRRQSPLTSTSQAPF